MVGLPLELQNNTLPLDAPQQPQIGSPLDQAPQEQASGFRNFVERVGLKGPSLLNSLSLAFGQSTTEIAARKRAARRQEIEDLIFEKQAQDFIGNRRQGGLVEDVGGFKRFSGSGERAFPGATATPKALSTLGKIQQDIDSGFITQEQVVAGGGGSAFAEKVDALVSTGIPKDVAIGIQAGRFTTTREPITGVAQVVDKSSGDVIFDGNQTPQVPPATAPQVAPAPGVPDVSQALGAGGVARAGANKIADLFGGELPFQEASEAQAQLSNLNNEAIQLMRAGLGGRPNVQLQKRIENLLVEPNEIFGGEQEAKNKFGAIIKTIDTEADRLQKEIDSGKIRPATSDEARGRISELRSLSGKFNSILSSQDQQDKGDIMRFFK